MQPFWELYATRYLRYFALFRVGAYLVGCVPLIVLGRRGYYLSVIYVPALWLLACFELVAMHRGFTVERGRARRRRRSPPRLL